MIKKKNNKKGFTLAELLIVVAIIAVLVAISVPIFNSQLEKSRDATDEANIRSAIAEVSAAVLSDDKATTDNGDVTYTAGADGAAGTYTATVKAQGKKAGWTGASSTTAKIKIGGVDVEPSTDGWTVTGTEDSGKVEVKAGLPAGN